MLTFFYLFNYKIISIINMQSMCAMIEFNKINSFALLAGVFLCFNLFLAKNFYFNLRKYYSSTTFSFGFLTARSWTTNNIPTPTIRRGIAITGRDE